MKEFLAWNAGNPQEEKGALPPKKGFSVHFLEFNETF